MLSVTAWKIESTLPMHIELYIIHFGILRPLESWWFKKHRASGPRHSAAGRRKGNDQHVDDDVIGLEVQLVP